MRARGGFPVAGAAVGIAMLDTRFPRIPGDIGNALTWPFPVLYRVVRGARPDLAVHGDTDQLLAAFIEAGHALVADGARGIVTSCGFLVRLQDRLRDELGVPLRLHRSCRCQWCRRCCRGERELVFSRFRQVR